MVDFIFLNVIFFCMRNILTENNIQDLKEFQLLLLKWQKTINLISKSSEKFIWERHIIDSAQLYPYIKGKNVLDLGSGGGFPALVLAIMDRDEKVSKFYMVERDSRKAAFLREVVRRFSLNAEVFVDSIENVKPFDFDFITSRALADVKKIIDLSFHLIKKDTEFFLMKGMNVDVEIESALIDYEFDYEKIKSITDGGGCILKINNLKKEGAF